MCNSHVLIFNLSITQLQQLKPKSNLAINELIVSKFMCINIKVNRDEFNSTVIGSGLTCFEVINTHIKGIQLDYSISKAVATRRVHTIRKGMRKLSERGVFFVNDIITPNGEGTLS